MAVASGNYQPDRQPGMARIFAAKLNGLRGVELSDRCCIILVIHPGDLNFVPFTPACRLPRRRMLQSQRGFATITRRNKRAKVTFRRATPVQGHRYIRHLTTLQQRLAGDLEVTIEGADGLIINRFAVPARCF